VTGRHRQVRSFGERAGDHRPTVGKDRGDHGDEERGQFPCTRRCPSGGTTTLRATRKRYVVFAAALLLEDEGVEFAAYNDSPDIIEDGAPHARPLHAETTNNLVQFCSARIRSEDKS
jgi:hypothetical protein